MTTYVIDDRSAACDSMWSDANGHECDVPIKKYLYISKDSENSDLEVEPSVTLYSGDYEQIVLHQALTLEIITFSQYERAAENYKNLGAQHLSYASVDFKNWQPSGENCRREHGLLFDGSGSDHALVHYRENYSVHGAVNHAIEHDPRSGHEINHIWIAGQGELGCMHFEQLTDEVYDEVYRRTEELHLALQSGELNIDMSKIKYAGCTTSNRAEADVFSPKDVVKKEKGRVSKIKSSKLLSNSRLSGHKRKKLSSSAFSSQPVPQSQADITKS